VSRRKWPPNPSASQARVYKHDGFAVTLWTRYEPVTPRVVSPADYANALERPPAGMRKLNVRTPHFPGRVELLAGRRRSRRLLGLEIDMPTVTELRVALTVKDFAQALAFYRDTLGLEQLADWSSEVGRVVVLDAGRATLELLDHAQAETVDAIEAGRRVSGTVRLAMNVADSDDIAQRLVAEGAVQVAPPVLTPWGDRNARVQTPEGIQLTLFTPV
jgi:catechol 2,3-dioxygenase-like lactoylglutathione lyase family enzyme